MLNQQMLDYIKQQMQRGVSQEQIKNALMANGWQEQEIEEAFNNLAVTNLPTAHAEAPVAASGWSWKMIAVMVSAVAVLAGGAYLAGQILLKPEKAPKLSNKVLNQLPNETPAEAVTSQPPSEQPASQTQPQNPEIVFADKLSSCTKYKTTFKHPLTGDVLEKEILGIMGEKCNYVEQMPNGGKMECKYSESERAVVAQYYKDIAKAESAGTSFGAELDSGEQQATYTINGKVVNNPLTEAITSGTCVISGY